MSEIHHPGLCLVTFGASPESNPPVRRGNFDGLTGFCHLERSERTSRQIFQGGKYNALQPVYSINLLNHIMDTKTDLWHHEYKLRHHKFHKRSLNDLTLHFFELPKWQKINKFDMNNPLDRWMQFLQTLIFTP
jgi:hypothetical protein